MNNSVLIIDDEKTIRESLRTLLTETGYSIHVGSTGKDFYELIDRQTIDVIVCDIKLPDTTGFELLEYTKKNFADIPFIIITGYASWETARKALKSGAFDYLAKPFKSDEVELLIRKALKHRSILKENQILKKRIQANSFSNIIGSSDEIKKVFSLIEKVAATNSTVLINGESGTGKELVANAIHNNSHRKDKPFIVVNCAAIPKNLIESELFGYVKGAFTGATKSKPGTIELADKGTIFFDEIGELPPELQVKLLRILEGHAFRRVGGNEEIYSDIRILAATNRNLEKMIDQNIFRRDLYYRLAVITIKLPPLRNRKEDIMLLANYFLDNFNKEMAKKITGFSDPVESIFMEYDWPGNIRELQNIVEHCVILEDDDIISEKSMPGLLKENKLFRVTNDKKFDTLDDKLEFIETELIIEKLKEVNWNKNRAAKLLGISRQSLQYKIQKLDIVMEE